MSSQWKLVPVEPTETMVINGFESEPDECFTDDEVWEQYQGMSGCQQAVFRAKLCWAAMINSAPVPAEADAQPVMKLEAEKLLGGHGEYAVSFVRAGWLDECRATGGEFLLYAHPDEDKVARLTAERDALQLRLTETDQRNDELSGMLQHLVDHPFRFTNSYRERIAATLSGEPATPAPTRPFTEQFIEDHLGKMPDQLRDAAKMIGIERMPPMEYDEP